MSHRMMLGVVVSVTLASGAAAAQNPAAERAHVEAARTLAGTAWAPSADLFCATEQQVADMHILPSANTGDVAGQLAAPMKVFDNLYFVGQKTVATWAITTPSGIILIDSGYKERVEDTLVAGMKKVGLDLANVRYVLIAHEHADHFGGAKYLQEHYPMLHVAASAVAWQTMERPGRGGEAPDAPKRDIVLEEGKAITLGGESVTPVAIPGHTPGSMSFIFQVKDNGTTHTAGLFGGTVLNPTAAIPFDQYQASIAHWAEWTRKMHVDVELQNHPIMDRAFERMAALKDRRKGQPNPFVVGEASYQNMVGVMNECANAQLARRAAK